MLGATKCFFGKQSAISGQQKSKLGVTSRLLRGDNLLLGDTIGRSQGDNMRAQGNKMRARGDKMSARDYKMRPQGNFTFPSNPVVAPGKLVAAPGV